MEKDKISSCVSLYDLKRAFKKCPWKMTMATSKYSSSPICHPSNTRCTIQHDLHPNHHQAFPPWVTYNYSFSRTKTPSTSTTSHSILQLCLNERTFELLPWPCLLGVSKSPIITLQCLWQLSALLMLMFIQLSKDIIYMPKAINTHQCTTTSWSWTWAK